MATFASLPEELIELILSYADVQTLVRCRQLAQSFAKLILQSVHLQYKLNLAIDGLIAGDSRGMSVGAQLDAVLERRKARRTLAYDQKLIVKAGSSRATLFFFSSDILGWLDLDQRETLHLLRVPSPRRQILEKSWTVALPRTFAAGYTVDYRAVDPLQDLLLVVNIDRHAGTCLVHFLSLCKGNAHPQARKSQLQVHVDKPEGVFWSCGAPPNALGDFAIVDIVQVGRARHFLHVLDWKSGDVLLTITVVEPTVMSCALLTKQYLLLVHTHFGELVYSVLDVRANRLKEATDVCTLDEIQYMCCFQFPRMHPTSVITQLDINLPHSRSSVSAPYSADDNRLLILQATYENEVFHSVTLLSTILRYVEKADNGTWFAWEEWGIQNSRLFLRSHFVVVKVFGSTTFILHYPLQNPAPTRALRINVIDFGVLGIRKHMADTATRERDNVDDTVQLSLEHPYGESQIFASNDIVTYLPALISETTVEIDHDISKLSGCCMGDDCLGLFFKVDERCEFHMLVF